MDKKLEKIKNMVNEKGIFHIFAIDHRDVLLSVWKTMWDMM